MRLKFYYIIGMILLCGCATQRSNKIINQAVFEKPATVVIAQLSGFENINYFKIGQQGIIDCVVNEIISNDVQEALQKIDLQPTVKEHFYEAFTNTFKSKAFEVKLYPTIIDKKNLSAFEKDRPEFSPYNFDMLRDVKDAEYALILNPLQTGLIRHYYSVIPLGRPKSLSNLDIYFIHLKSNTILGYYQAETEMPIEGQWDYNLSLTISDAVKRNLLDAHSNLFGWTIR